MIGQRFGLLTVVASTEGRKHKRWWVCECDCGGLTISDTATLRGLHKKSCGCLKSTQGRVNGLAQKRHGHTSGPRRSPTWISWAKMRERVRNPNHVKYHLYGGRGVSIDPAWDSFEQFLADMGDRPEGRSLDRIDPYGDYGPGNCRWATPLEQRHNRRAKAVA